ncbi:hypothetical protein FWK35_00037158, partial [Aphis craccivora]
MRPVKNILLSNKKKITEIGPIYEGEFNYSESALTAAEPPLLYSAATRKRVKKLCYYRGKRS